MYYLSYDIKIKCVTYSKLSRNAITRETVKNCVAPGSWTPVCWWRTQYVLARQEHYLEVTQFCKCLPRSRVPTQFLMRYTLIYCYLCEIITTCQLPQLWKSSHCRPREGETVSVHHVVRVRIPLNQLSKHLQRNSQWQIHSLLNRCGR